MSAVTGIVSRSDGAFVAQNLAGDFSIQKGGREPTEDKLDEKISRRQGMVDLALIVTPIVTLIAEVGILLRLLGVPV